MVTASIPLASVLLLSPVLAWSPSNSYAPAVVDCPPGHTFIRPADTLHPREQEWLKGRDLATQGPLLDFLRRSNLDFDPAQFVYNDDHPARIGLAFSGGGFRAMISGAGQLNALDGRAPGTASPGNLGGLLQASTYLSGLSGGSWLVVSVYFNNFTTIGALMAHNRLWQLESGALFPPDPIDVWGDKIKAALQKLKAGYYITLTDSWGGILSNNLIDLPNGGSAADYSDLAQYAAVQNYEAPLPIVLAAVRPQKDKHVPDNTTVIEFTPYAFSSFDPTVYAHAEMEYLGTKFVNGSVTDQKCKRGFDSGAFVAGTSATVFNGVLYNFMINAASILRPLFRSLFDVIDTTNLDVAWYSPNPFYQYANPGLNNQVSAVAADPHLALVDDGSFDNVPFQPLLNHERDIDVIFALDNSADTPDNWPSGLVLERAYQRQFDTQVDFSDPVTFPYVPASPYIISHGLNKRPVFFGCDVKNLTTLAKKPPPLVVYIPNYQLTYPSNTSTFQLKYSRKDLEAIVQNGHNIASQMNGTIDEDWQTCLSCAILNRSLYRKNQTSGICNKCFENYCWQGPSA